MSRNVASSTVYPGRVGTGGAQVLGAPGDPLGAYKDLMKEQQAREIAKQKADEEAKKRRDERTKEIYATEPESTWEPFNAQVNSAFDQKIREETRNAIKNGEDIFSPDFQAKIDRNMDEVNAIARRGNYIKDTVDSAIKAIQDDDYLDYDYYIRAINDAYRNPDGSIKSYDDIRVEDISEVVRKDVGGFKIGKYANDFMKNLKANVVEFARQSDDGMDVRTDTTKIKSMMYVPDPNSRNGIKMSPDGKPVINVTDEVVNAFLGKNPKAAEFIAQEAERTNDTPRNVIAKYIADHAYVEKTVSSKINRKSEGGSGRKDRLPGQNRRIEKLNEIKNAFYDVNSARLTEPSKEAQKVLGSLNNSSYAGKKIKSSKIIPGGTKGKGQKKEFNNDMLELEVISGSSGGRMRTEKIYLDMSDPKFASEVNGILNKSEAEGEEYSWSEELEPLIFENPDSFQDRSQIDENIVKMKGRIENWQRGIGLSRLKNMDAISLNSSDGNSVKRIKEARQVEKTGEIEVFYQDGTKDVVSANDYDYFNSIVNLFAQDFVIDDKGNKTFGITWK